jgi:adenine phosphoribosyltransferase
MNSLEKELRDTIREVLDFPKPGINFKDITPILENPVLCKKIVSAFAEHLSGSNIHAIAGIESRGFLFGLPLALEMGIPFIIIRKKGKLPYKTVSHKYDLEYGSAEIEVNIDTLQEGWNVAIHDDLLATGGTAAAAAELIISQKANVKAFTFLVGLDFLQGNEKLQPYSKNIVSLIKYS